MKSVTIGTAGHIDHGKSTLIAALTGKDPDRLPEEKRRGITIDLGFADLDLGEVLIGFVDVPGHERFVKNMLAGAHGIDAVALIIAADEGVMPQTREHFDICRLLGINDGLVVITKSDLVEEELLELVRTEAEELVAGSFLEGAPIVTVSAKTGAGLDELRSTLRAIGARVPARSVDYISRLPVDRAFTIKGFGAVVTGTLISGEIAEGDELELMPERQRVRARGVQVHGKSTKRGIAGQRTAVNLGGIDVAELGRGMVLSAVGHLRPTQVLDVQIEVLPEAPRALRSRSRVRFHMHAAEILGRVRVLNAEGQIRPGQKAYAQISLEAPVASVMRDRFILRSYTPSRTIAGGYVLDPFARKHRGREFAAVQDQLTSLSTADHSQLVTNLASAAGETGLVASDIAARTGWKDEVLNSVLKDAVTKGSIVEAEGVFILSAIFASLAAKTVVEVRRHHQKEPLARGLARETLRERVLGHAPPEVFRAVLKKLESDKALVSEKDVVHLPDHKLEVKGADAELRDNLERVYASAGLEPPSLEDALQKAGIPRTQVAHGRKLLQLLIDDQKLVRFQGDLLFHRGALAGLKAKLLEYGAAHEPSRLIDVATFKDLAGVSRKYAIPLLEYFDRERITRRAGDQRLILK